VDRATRTSWLIWTTAALVYFAALFHRTALGVAGLEASERFGLGPAQLGVFTVLQIGVYALMQIPTGLLVDRYGPRRVLTAAALLMGTGQVLFAIADSYGLGLVARAVLGMGDAMAVDLAPHGIRANTIGPTFVQTPLTRPFFERAAFKDWVLSKIKLGRLGQVEDLMGAVVFLASDASALMTGSALVVDGGWTAE